ncbi:DUF1570 domain-containing protein [Telmatocola sphagniphila]|uniref:DUF1570 domain-containing protein n=1 Tax=Telmatocola sphagniphila TaxID=1123043 RepID=A0A8E6B8N6_9BACT|nr:DUF1570 domain-containing protein [Telmatocola sphagniphila]QVL33407.1 DUF1570 domain-containing protein [Telmatocola sphagniphila]
MSSPRFRNHRFFSVLWLAALLIGVQLGCASFKSNEEKETKAALIPAPGKYSLRLSQYVFYADFPLKDHSGMFQELAELHDQVFNELQLPPSTAIVQVFLFEDQARYEKYMRNRYPDLPRRRAFFISQPRSSRGTEDLLVFTYWGDNITEDLRHELTHALLHSSLHEVPLWLDEGLAEYFELPPANHGLNSSHLEQLRRGPFTPDLARMEQLNQVQQMERAEYREAWAWVHYLMQSKPDRKKVLLDYLQELRTPQRSATSMMSRLRELTPTVNDELRDHLAGLDENKVGDASKP